MTLNFTLDGSMATDPELGIDIYAPRLEPGYKASDIEYQYKVVIRGQADGIALSGVNNVTRSGLLSESYTQVSLSREDDVRWILDVKQEVASAEEDFAFLAAFSAGLLLTLISHSALYTTFYYTLLADEAVLIRTGVTVPAGAKRDSTGRLVLAQLAVPRRGGTEAGASK